MTADPQPQLSVPIQTPSKCASTGAGVNSVDDGIDRVHRTIHLSGGRRAHSLVDGRVLLDPFKDGLGPIEIKADSYYGVFDQLHKLGLPVIGVDFQITELDGQHPRPSSWRSRTVLGDKEWPTNELSDQWGFVGHGAMKAKNGYIWDLARRISHQSWLTNWRYRELSEAYRDHVVVGLKGGKGKTTGRFANEFTELVYSALQSFMIDACILRDNLAEFYWWHLRQGGYVKSSKTVTTMGGLLNGQFKAAKVPDRVHSFILDGTTENTGWIWLLTEYRNLVVHVAPLTLADQVLFASWVETDVNGRSVVGVKLPLPKNPLALSKSRNDGSLFEDPAGTRATFANVMKDDANTLDCLQYATTVVSGLALLSWHTIFVSPIKPKMPEFHIVEGKIVEKD